MAEPNDSDDEEWRSRHTTPRLGGVDYLAAQMQRLERELGQLREGYRVDRAIVLGVEGSPGRLGVVELGVTAMSGRLGVVESWKTSITAKIAVGIAIGTPIAGLATALILRWLGH